MLILTLSKNSDPSKVPIFSRFFGSSLSIARSSWITLSIFASLNGTPLVSVHLHRNQWRVSAQNLAVAAVEGRSEEKIGVLGLAIKGLGALYRSYFPSRGIPRMGEEGEMKIGKRGKEREEDLQ